jgi:predicted branched-subunit amino acid permease
MLGRYGPVYAIPALLAIVGPLVLVGVTHGGFLPFALAWWGVALVIALVRNRRARIAATAALIPLCILTVFEGGLFMFPAALALLVIDLRARSGTAGHGRVHPSRP